MRQLLILRNSPSPGLRGNSPAYFSESSRRKKAVTRKQSGCSNDRRPLRISSRAPSCCSHDRTAKRGNPERIPPLLERLENLPTLTATEHMDAAVLYANLKQNEAALRHLDAAARGAEKPAVEDYYLDLSLLYVEQGNDEQAEKVISAGLGRVPDSYRLLVRKGAILEGTSKKEEAIESFRKAHVPRRGPSARFGGPGLDADQWRRNQAGAGNPARGHGAIPGTTIICTTCGDSRCTLRSLPLRTRSLCPRKPRTRLRDRSSSTQTTPILTIGWGRFTPIPTPRKQPGILRPLCDWSQAKAGQSICSPGSTSSWGSERKAAG